MKNESIRRLQKKFRKGSREKRVEHCVLALMPLASELERYIYVVVYT